MFYHRLTDFLTPIFLFPANPRLDVFSHESVTELDHIASPTDTPQPNVVSIQRGEFMKHIAVRRSVLAVGILLGSGNAAIAESDVSNSHSAVTVGLELNKITEIKYVLDASSADLTLGSESSTLESDKESAKFTGEEALVRIGVRISPAIEFHGILGNTKSKSNNFFDSKNGLLFGAGVSATPPSSSSWKSNIGFEVTRTTVKESGASLGFNASSDDGVTVKNYYGTGTGTVELQLTKIDLSALAIYKTGSTEPYMGLMYSIISGTLDTKLRGTASGYSYPSGGGIVTNLPSIPFTIDESRDVSLDSQMGLTLGFNAHVADAMDIGFGAMVGTRTQYSAHVEYSF